MRLWIEKLVHRGLGLGRVDGKVWLVPLTAPGDLVEVRPVSEKGRHTEGVVERVLEPGPDRIEPLCPFYGRCGGCHLQHITYSAQLETKVAILKDLMERTGRVAAPNIEVVSGEPFHYRSRIELHGRGPKVGLFGRGSHEIIEVNSCAIARPEVASLISLTASACQDPRPAGPFDIEWVADGEGSAVGLLIADFYGPLLSNLAALKGVTGLCVRRRTGNKWVVTSGSTRIKWPSHSPVGPIYLECEARDFSQANSGLNPMLVSKVLMLASPKQGERCFEAYAGAGNLTIPLLLTGCSVTAIELSRDAIADAERSAKRYGLEGRFIAGDVTRHARRLASQGERFDIVVADPPRSGLNDPLSLVALGPTRILLVSCEPSALARDVSKLAQAGFSLSQLVLVDMFPQTYHIEAIALLERI